MALSLMIIFIVIVFTLFSYFICCYGAAEEKRRNRFETSYPSTSFENNVCVPPINRIGYRNPNPTNIGFNVSTDEPTRVIPPVGVVPNAPNFYSPENITPYPPALAPYPVVDSDVFPRPEITPLKPSAPIEDNTLPPSYYEATKYKY